VGVFLFLWSVFSLLALPALGTPLPDILGEPGGELWVAGPPRVTALEVGSENLGQWQNRIYRRTAPIASVEVNLMEGEGFGAPYVPGADAADGPAADVDGALFPASSAYETLKIGEKYAILESNELTGVALSVALGGNRTLLAESAGLSPEELSGFAERLIRALPAEERDAK
jgi:hypothetical protein